MADSWSSETEKGASIVFSGLMVNVMCVTKVVGDKAGQSAVSINHKAEV